MVPLLLPIDLFGTVLKPIGQSHVAMSEIDCILPLCFRSHGVLLRKYQTHNLAESYILEEELNMDGIGRVFHPVLVFVLKEIVFADHLNV